MTGPADVARGLLRGLGQTLITLGVVVLLFCVYELYFTNLYTDRAQARLGKELQHAWAQPAPVVSATPRPTAIAQGAAIAIIRIPRLGRDYHEVVIEGVSHEDLKLGPGHYPGTAMPGQLGNMVISGHRTTYSAPFNRVDELRPGDAIVLETRDTWFTYRVTGEQIVAPTAIEVTYAVPGHKNAVPTKRLLTLTTCNPKYSASQRLIVDAQLHSVLPRAGGAVPPALAGA